MRPYPEEVLRAIQSGVVAHFAPELKSTYGQAQFAFSMLLFTIVQRDYDTAVPDLVERNAALRALLADAHSRARQRSIATTPAAARDAARTRCRRRRRPSASPPSAPRTKRSARSSCQLAPLIEPAGDDPPSRPSSPSASHLRPPRRRRQTPHLPHPLRLARECDASRL